MTLENLSLPDDPKRKSLEDKTKIPEVGSTFDDVVRYALTPEGAIDLRKMEQLEGRFGYNGGRGCDVQDGPCSCGAWH